MPCFSPLVAWQLEGGEVVFKERGKVSRELKLPCGQCIGCRLEKSRQWATRCMHEAQMHEASCFLTLTYNDENLKSPSLDYRDFQLFCKRVRHECGPFRFYMCGEYGEKTWRPHFHACMFGLWFGDYKLYRTLPTGFRLFTSETLSRLWPYGFSSFGMVTFESAAYVARYVCKKVTGRNAEEHYKRVDCSTGEIVNLVPEFARMSLKPGIGEPWFRKYISDVYPNGQCIIRGRSVKAPRYYDELYSECAPLEYDWMKFERERDALKHVDDCTDDRLRVREIVTRARISSLKRNLE